jgi:hypothetical protein
MTETQVSMSQLSSDRFQFSLGALMIAVLITAALMYLNLFHQAPVVVFADLIYLQAVLFLLMRLALRTASESNATRRDPATVVVGITLLMLANMLVILFMLILLSVQLYAWLTRGS